MANKEEILILSVGGSEEPLIYSINEFKPDKVVFLHTPGTLYQIAKILDKVNWNKDNDIILDISHYFSQYKNILYSIFKEFIPNFPKENENDKFYDDLCNFFDREKLKNKEEFNSKFLDYLYQINSEKNHYNVFTKIINENKLSEDLFLKITEVVTEHKKNTEEYIISNINNILENSNFEDDIIIHEEIRDHESLDNSFTVSKNVFNNFKDRDKFNVKVDFTGGTKPMVSGIVLAVVEGNFTNFEFRYVGSKKSSKRTKKGLGIVENGSEITKIQYNPYEKYGITEFKRGKNFFDSYQFKEASENFKNAFETLDEGPRKDLSKYYMKLSRFYHSWDKFNEKIKFLNDKIDREERFKLNQYLSEELIDKCPKEFFDEDFNNSKEFFKQMESNCKFLNLKLSKNINKGIEYYLPDLLNNAYRKIERGNYDDAIARLYRSLELIAQINLNRINLYDEHTLKSNKEFHINKDKFKKVTKEYPEARYKVEKWHIQEYEDPEKKTFKIPLFRSFILLKCFNIQIAFDELLDENLDSSQNRNGSILAHGLKAMDYDTSKEFYDKILEFSVKTIPDIKKYMEIAKFPSFND